MTSYSVLAFDYDGTLVDSRNAIVTSVQDAFVEFGLGKPAWNSVLEIMGRPVEKTFPALHGTELGAEKETALVNRFRAIYKEKAKTDLSVYPGIIEMLARLKLAKKKIGIVTSKISSAAWDNSRQLGIADYFSYIIGAHEVTNPKPDPEPLRVLCEKFGRKIDSEVIVIGDATFDIELAHNSGVHSCAVTWGARDEESLRKVNPTYVARTVAELGEILCS